MKEHICTKNNNGEKGRVATHQRYKPKKSTHTHTCRGRTEHAGRHIAPTVNRASSQSFTQTVVEHGEESVVAISATFG